MKSYIFDTVWSTSFKN